MTLKYKLGDVVVLGDNVSVNYRNTFIPRAIVKITQLYCVDDRPEDAHYTIELVSSSEGPWWVKDDEINHEATEALQKSNETMDIVGKEQAISDDNAQEVRTPVLELNAPQTGPQSTVENTFSTAYSSVSVFHKSNTKECLKITIDGEFLVFQQECDGDVQEIHLDFNAVGAVFSAANELIVQYKEKK